MDARTKVCGRAGWTRVVGLCALVLAAAVPTVGAAQGLTLREGSVGPFYTRSVLWGAADITESNIRRLYGSVSGELSVWHAWTVSVFTDETDAVRELGAAKTADEPDYDRWLGQYNAYGRNLLPMAEIVASSGSAVARLRTAAGDCSEVVLAGDNFLRTDIEGVGFEVLKIVYHPLPPAVSPTRGDDAMLSVFVRVSEPPDEGRARRFTQALQERFHEKRIIAAFRNDSYFLTDFRFPIVYRFDPVSTPPNRKEYAEHKAMYCFGDLPGIPCR